MFEHVKVLFLAATKSVHSIRLSGLLPVETTVCVTKAVVSCQNKVILKNFRDAWNNV